MKKVAYGALLVGLVAVMVMACTSGTTPAPGGPPATVQAPAGTPAKSAWETLIEAARREREVVVVGSSVGAARESIMNVFTGKYGINVDFTVSGRAAETVNKLSSERKAGLFLTDIVILGGTSFFNNFEPLGMAVPLEPLLVLPEVKDPTKWRTGQIPFIDARKTAVSPAVTKSPLIVINTNMVKEGEITSNYDLLDPKWKGKLVINDPTVAGNGSNWFSYTILISLGGREKGEEYMKKLIAQQPEVLRDQRLLVEWVARGKYPIGIGSDQAETVKMMDAGAPIKFIEVKEGWPLTQGPWAISVLDKAAHPDAARLFVNWILSKEGGETISSPSGYPSERLDVSKEKFSPMFVPGPSDVLRGKEYLLEKGKMLGVAAGLFKDLLK